ncbi:uncharacterized protein LOC107038394 isoform X2 [Diachasma alloeum]|uniref:uncharacterized protein LOC107038394 isoform X2 n=1 Tax=Diachasma alloeum TaxID=454923 RepID=UPI000738142C|nr:uncharacterized protein LOC107038394 isoform X2 [Diachasma alloeum]
MRKCRIPNCPAEPEETVFRLPSDSATREKWRLAIRKVYPNLRVNNWFTICGRHFRSIDFGFTVNDGKGNVIYQLDEDLENYMEWKMTGCRKRLKEGVYPRYFSCQATSKFASAYVSPCAAPSSSGIKEEVEVKEEDPLAIEDQPQIKVEDGAPSFRLVEPFNFVGIKSESVDLAEDTIDNTRLQ